MAWGLVPEEEDYSLKGKYDEPSWLPAETVAPKAYVVDPAPVVVVPAPEEEKKPEEKKSFFATPEEEQKYGGKGPNYPGGREAVPEAEQPQKQPPQPEQKPPHWREPIMAELDKNPQTKMLAMQMLDTEGGGVATMEALVNRVAMIRQRIPDWSLWDELNSGFYGPINRGYAQTRKLSEGAIAQYQKDIDAVRAGSNVIQGRTDQGYRGDPNFYGPGRVAVQGQPNESYNFWTGRRRGVDFSHKDAAQFAHQVSGGGGDLKFDEITGQPSKAAPVYHDTAPDGTRPMGEGRYIWPGEKGDPSQPAGEGKYIWPGAKRASPEEIESARYGPFRNPFRDPLADTAPLDPQAAIAEASGFPWPQAEPVHGYTPAPTPISVYGYNPNPIAPPQPQGVTAQYPFEFGIAPPTQQVDQYRYGTGTLPPDYGTQQPAAPAVAPAPVTTPAPAVAPAPAQEAAPQLAPGELAQSRNPGEQLTSYLNMINRGMTSEGVLSMIEGLDALALHHLPDWKVLDWLRDNLKSEQKQTAFLRNKLRQDVFPVDRATTESKVGQVLQVLGQAVPTAGLGALTGGAGVASSIVTGLQAAGQLFDEARQDALQHGATEEQANRTALQYLGGAGVFEYISDRFLIGRLFHGGGKLTVGQIAKEFGKGGALEGVTEAGQQGILNWLAKGNYDPNRPLGQDVLDSAIVGVFGGGIGAAGARAAGHLVGKATEQAQQGDLQQAVEQLKGIKAEDVGTELTPEEQEAFKKAGASVTPPTEPTPTAPPETKPSETKPPTAEGEVKASLAMPEAPVAPETVKVRAFDAKAREFVEAEMKPTKELHEQLKREENAYTALIKCLEL